QPHSGAGPSTAPGARPAGSLRSAGAGAAGRAASVRAPPRPGTDASAHHDDRAGAARAGRAKS
nr:hypothetical protein [Tanacetum cinerariifolium]